MLPNSSLHPHPNKYDKDDQYGVSLLQGKPHLDQDPSLICVIRSAFKLFSISFSPRRILHSTFAPFLPSIRDWRRLFGQITVHSPLSDFK